MIRERIQLSQKKASLLEPQESAQQNDAAGTDTPQGKEEGTMVAKRTARGEAEEEE